MEGAGGVDARDPDERKRSGEQRDEDRRKQGAGDVVCAHIERHGGHHPRNGRGEHVDGCEREQEAAENDRNDLT